MKASEPRRPLEGLTVVVTGSRRAAEQSALVSNLGGVPYVVPTVGISLPASDEDVEPFLNALTSPEGVDYAVFMTATGVRTMMLAAERLRMKEAVLRSLNRKETVVVARSGKPRGELAKHGVKVDASPPREEATASGIVRLLRERGLGGKKVAILWHGSKNESTARELLAAGAGDVVECLTYRYSRELGAEGAGVLGSMGFKYEAPEEEGVLRLIGEIAKGGRRIDAVTFTSPPAVSNLFEIAAEHGLEDGLREGLRERKIAVVAVGSSTRSELEEYGVEVQVTPEVPAMGAMMNALAAYLGEDDAMLIDLVLKDRDALVVGRGRELEFKALKLLDAKANITVLSDGFTAELRRLASKNKKSLRLVEGKVDAASLRKAIKETSPRVVFVSTGDSGLDEELADAARPRGRRSAIVCVVDDPRLNDFNMPAIAKLGDIRVGVSTGGKSPAMAGILRRKIEKTISPEDVLQVRLQGHIRRAARKLLNDPAARKEFAYKVIRDKRIGALLRGDDYPAARRLAEEMLREEVADA